MGPNTPPILSPIINGLEAKLAALTSMAKHRSVNLVQLATTEDGRTCFNESRYRRFQDFFLRTRLWKGEDQCLDQLELGINQEMND